MNLKIWSCKVGYADADRLPPGSDGPMRDAVQDAFEQLTGLAPDFTFSGWGAQLSPGELAVVNDTDPPEWPGELVDALKALADEHGKALVAHVAQSLWMLGFMPPTPGGMKDESGKVVG
jgi:hypothetical protein